MNIDLNTDGPHSPDYTREVGNALAEAVRVLNYATRGEADGLEYPGDVYTLLGALYTATGRMPQLLTQLVEFLAAQGGSGTLADDHGRNVPSQIAEASYHLGHAHGAATALTKALQQAQQSISGLYVKDTP